METKHPPIWRYVLALESQRELGADELERVVRAAVAELLRVVNEPNTPIEVERRLVGAVETTAKVA